MTTTTTVYNGLCINGPHDGAMMAYDDPVLRVPMAQLDRSAWKLEDLKDTEMPITYREYFYEDVMIGGHRFGFWLYEGTTMAEAIWRMCERYNTD